MTFILAGKYKSEAFLMVDTVVDNDDSKIDEKLYISVTDHENIMSLTGDYVFMYFIQLFDDWLLHTNGKLILNKESLAIICNSLSDFLNRFNSGKIEGEKKFLLGRNRLFLLRGNKIKYIDVYFENNELKDIRQKNLNDNKCVLGIDKEIPIEIDIKDSYSFSVFGIHDRASQCEDIHHEKINPKIYFKNGFSFYSSITGCQFATYNKDFKAHAENTKINPS